MSSVELRFFLKKINERRDYLLQERHQASFFPISCISYLYKIPKS